MINLNLCVHICTPYRITCPACSHTYRPVNSESNTANSLYMQLTALTILPCTYFLHPDSASVHYTSSMLDTYDGSLFNRECSTSQPHAVHKYIHWSPMHTGLHGLGGVCTHMHPDWCSIKKNNKDTYVSHVSLRSQM